MTVTGTVSLTVAVAVSVAVAAAARCPGTDDTFGKGGLVESPQHHLRKPRSLCHRSRPAPLTAVGCHETETQALWDVQLLLGHGDADDNMNRTIPVRARGSAPRMPSVLHFHSHRREER